MTKPSVRKKPTNKEIASAIIEISNKVNDLEKGLGQAYQILRQMDIVVGMYVDMNKDTDKFNEFIKLKKIEAEKANDAKENGDSDKKDIPTDTGHEGSGAERIREESK
tara:strand:- start:308 stop:631 length:324 start_codon:yes stop_codon:yes gene_type:complete